MTRVILRPEELALLQTKPSQSPTCPSPLAHLQEISRKLRSVSTELKEMIASGSSIDSHVGSARSAISRMMHVAPFED